MAINVPADISSGQLVPDSLLNVARRHAVRVPCIAQNGFGHVGGDALDRCMNSPLIQDDVPRRVRSRGLVDGSPRTSHSHA